LGTAEIEREFNRHAKVVAEDATPAPETGNWRAMEGPIMTFEQLQVFV
jgi:hypothetical protein